MEQFKIAPSTFYSIAVHSENTLNISINISDKYSSDYFLFDTIRQKIKSDYPQFNAQEETLRSQLYELLHKVKNSGLEPFPQTVLVSLTL